MLVTGTSRGIGRATALRLAARGMSVVAAVRTPEDGAAVERACAGDLQTILFDLTSEESIGELATRLAEIVGEDGLYGLVNNAATSGRASPIESVTRETLEGAYRGTAFGTILTTAALLPLVRRAKGRIVNVGAGRLPLPPLGPGLSAKLAMEAMTDHLRIEVRRLGVGVSIVYPGMTRWEDTDEQLAVYGQEVEASLRHVAEDDRAYFAASVEKVKAMQRRFMATAVPADRVAATIERALTARRPRARYFSGWEQKMVALLERVTTERVRDALVVRMVGL